MNRYLGIGLCLLLASCSSDGLPPVDSGGEARPKDKSVSTAEDTAARCQDGKDNDGDGFVDCLDQDCEGFAFCRDLGSPDVPLSDAPAPDTAPSDLPLPDLPAPDLPPPPDLFLMPDKPQSPDAPALDLLLPDLPLPDIFSGDTGVPCKGHHDCPQKWYCYLNKCTRDLKMDVFHCGKPGCPPGHWCVDAVGKKLECKENTGYKCIDACDCGPAHCCKGGVCVKDTKDPWKPGGTAVGTACKEGTDATYCCSEPECHAGRFAFGGNARFFRCHNRSTKKVEQYCGGKSCFGTACNCSAGEACVDTTSKMPPGKTCLLLSGGTCVSNAVAETFYGFKSSDLLPCCTKGCLKGTKCDAGWRSDARYGYVRVIASCGSCGNGTCDDGESLKDCAQDCKCGDGVCSPDENYKVKGTGYSYSVSFPSCKQDCNTWGNGKCDPWESPVLGVGSDCDGCGSGWCLGTETLATCAQDCGGRCVDASLFPGLHRICGDGLCETGRTDEMETCESCPKDCGPCASGWVQDHRSPAWLGEGLNAVWGTSPTSVWVVGDNGTVLHFDGTKWSSMISGLQGRHGVYAGSPASQHRLMDLHDVWGISDTEVYAVGGRCSGSSCDRAVLRFDGKSWEPIYVAAEPPLKAVWAGGGQIFAVTSKGTILHHDGNTWNSPAIKPKYLYDVWGTAPTNVYAVGLFGTVLRFDGSGWSTVNIGSTQHLQAVWGSSPSDVYTVGFSGAMFHFDGKAWSKVPSVTKMSLYAIGGSSASNIFASGYKGTAVRFDGVNWTTWDQPQTGTPSSIQGIWAHPGGAFAVTGGKSCPSGKTCTGGILRLDNNKSTWSTLVHGTRTTLYDVWSGSASHAVAVGAECGLGASKGTCGPAVMQRKGGQWISMDPVPGSGLRSVWGSGASDYFAVGNNGTIVRHDGSKWSAMNSGVGSTTLAGVWGTSPANVFAVGSKGTILRFNGSKWSPMNSGTGQTLTAVYGFSPTSVFAAGTQGTVLRFDGAKWNAMNTGHSSQLNALWGTGPTDLYAVGISGFVLHFDGTKWKPNQVPGIMAVSDIIGLPGGDIYLLAGGVFFRSSPQGWIREPLDLRTPSSLSYEIPALYGMAGTTSGELLAVGTQEMILRRCAGGKCP